MNSDNNTQQTEQTPDVIPFEILEKRRLNALKIGKAKQKVILKALGESWNRSKACHKAGITYAAFQKTMKNDPQFNQAVTEIHNSYLNIMEESSVIVGSTADARGFNDRKLQLQAHRPETYAKQPEIQINQQINLGSGDEISSILQRIAPKTK